MLKNYLKTAWRSMFKNKFTAFINISGLSVGMAAAVLILLWVQNEMSFDNYHPGNENIYRLTTSIKANDWTWESTPLLLADAAKSNVPGIEKIARLNTSHWPVFNVNGNTSYEKECAYIDDSWFTVFKYDFIAGDAASFGSDINGIVLTETMAKKYFGNGNIIGSTIRIDSSNYTVRGIIRDAPANSSFQYKAYMSVASLLTDPQIKENDANWDNFNYVTFVKLRPGVDLSVLSKKLSGLIPGNEEGGTEISLTSLKDMHFEKDMQSSIFPHGNLNTVYIFSALAFLLLLVACINYVNLTTAKASLRAKEVSVRKMVGAKRLHLFYQFVAESLMISLIALITTLILIKLALPFFNEIAEKNFDLALSSLAMWRIIGITLLAALLLNSIYPAILLSSFKPLKVFRGASVLKINDVYFRKGLVIVQFTISVILIASTIIIYSQMRFIQNTNPGYNRSQVVAFPLPPDTERSKKELLVQTIKHQLLSNSSIEMVTIANQPIVSIGSMSTNSADWDGHDTSFNPRISQLSTDADFQKALQLQLKEGRWFQQGNEMDKDNVVLNETAVATFNLHKPVIGQRFTFKGRKGQVIGVVKDFNFQSMHNKTAPLVAFNDPAWFNFFMVRITPGSTSKAISTIQDTWRKILPGKPLDYNFLDDSFNELYKADSRISLLILVFAIIAVVISALGLFGLAAFTAEQRTKEIGIRKVLGASITNIAALLSGDFVKLVCIAIIIAVPFALWVMNKWIQDFAYRINMGWWMFAAAGVLALLVALLTTSFQAVKAALTNPVKSLRTE